MKQNTAFKNKTNSRDIKHKTKTRYIWIKHFASILKYTIQKMKFPIKDFFSKCDQIRSFLRIWSHLLKKSLMENFIFCPVLGLRLQT